MNIKRKLNIDYYSIIVLYEVLISDPLIDILYQIFPSITLLIGTICFSWYSPVRISEGLFIII